MIVKNKNLSNYKASHKCELTAIFSHPWTDGIQGLILYSFSQTSEEQTENQSLFTLKTLWRDTNEN